MTAFLEVRAITKVFGGLKAVDAVSFDVEPGQIIGLVGPNGSGKSTVLNVLSGVYAADGGSVHLGGRPTAGLRPSAVAAAGLSRTFQNLQLFAGLTIGQNVMVGAHHRLRATVLGSVFGSPYSRREEAETAAEADRLLTLVGLPGVAQASPADLSYGQRRLLEIARGLASHPKILMLDEPCAGLSQSEADDLAAVIRTLAKSGTGIIVIEHNMRFVMALVDRIVALNFGMKIAEGDPATIRGNEAVIAAYLGRTRHAGG